MRGEIVWCHEIDETKEMKVWIETLEKKDKERERANMNFNRSVRHRERERERNSGREGVRKKESGDKIKK